MEKLTNEMMDLDYSVCRRGHTNEEMKEFIKNTLQLGIVKAIFGDVLLNEEDRIDRKVELFCGRYPIHMDAILVQNGYRFEFTLTPKSYHATGERITVNFEVPFIPMGCEWVFAKNTQHYTKIIKVKGEIFALINGCYVNARLINMDNVITLTNGNFLLRDYGKYGSGLAFISQVPSLEEQYIEIPGKDLNIPRPTVKILYGEYFVSKKGTKCFRIKLDGRHMLVADDWGGPFEKYRGGTILNGIYTKRACSNNGGRGVDYAINERGWKYTLKEEEI